MLVLSDVIGDDLDVIASGPCMPSGAVTPPTASGQPLTGCRVRHVIVGDNGTAVAAALRNEAQAGEATLTCRSTRCTAAGIAAVNIAGGGGPAIGRRG